MAIIGVNRGPKDECLPCITGQGKALLSMVIQGVITDIEQDAREIEQATGKKIEQGTPLWVAINTYKSLLKEVQQADTCDGRGYTPVLDPWRHKFDKPVRILTMQAKSKE